MKQYSKRLISFLLSVIMLFSVIPVHASAASADVNTKVLYRYREKAYTTSEKQLNEPWLLYNQTEEELHGQTLDVFLEDDEVIDTSKYCVHYKMKACKYAHQTISSRYKWVLTTEANHDYYYDYDTYGNLWWHYADGYKYSCCLNSSKSIVTTYHYYQWSEWSEWSETPVSATDDVEVEIKTVTLFTIVYDANGGSGAPSSTTKEYGKTVTLSTIIPARENHRFLGWSTASDGDVEYTPGGEYSDNADVTLYAVWKNVTEYTVTYYANGGTGAPAPQTKIHGESITISSEIPTKEGYSFLGWSTAKDGEVDYSAGSTYSFDSSIVLYAAWKEKANAVASGECGEDLAWTLYDDGLLLISGTGTMYDWDSCGAPWWSYRSQIDIVEIEDGCTTIGSHAFAILSGMTPYEITTVTLPSTLSAINYRAFYLCASITRINVPTPNSVEIIDDYAFYKCTSLQELPLFENLKTIGSSAFYNCTAFTSIELNSRLETIGWYAFACCDSVETIEIQENLKTIGTGAFNSCDKLQRITVHPDNPYFANDDNGVLYDTVNHILLQYPNGSLTTSYAIDNATVEIARSAFSCCYNLQEVYLPKSLSIIDAYNFANSVHQQIQTMYYAGTSIEWDANITVKAPDSSGLYAAMSYDVIFNNGAVEYMVSYNKNGSNYLESITSQIKVHNVDLTLTTEKFTRTGYKFKGWSTTSDGDVEYLPGEVYSKNANVTLYAVWEINIYEVGYDANGGINAPQHQIKNYGTAITLSNTVPTYLGFDFLGWATAADGDVEYLPGDIYSKNANITLFAIWGEHIHNWDDGTVTIEPTCATDGVKTYTCSDCSATYTEVVPATGEHVYGDWQKLDGDKHIHYCTGAGCETSETADHVWNNGVVTTEPTCATDGVKTFTCSDCGATYTESVPATSNHTYSNWQKYDADNHIHYCTAADCEASETADHVWNNGIVTIAPTCATDGVKTFTCTDCEATYTETVPATSNHTYGNWQKLDENSHIRYCTGTDCNASETANHIWNNGIVTTQPTCATAGVKTYTCSDCGATYTEAVPATGKHVYGEWQKLDGNSHIRYCTAVDCDASETADHVWNNGIITTSSTCITEGVKTFTCYDCSASYTEAIPVTGVHVYGEWQTYNDEGYIRYCTVSGCEAYEITEHEWNTGVITSEPACSIPGIKMLTCVNCGITKTESIPATDNHTYGDWQKLDGNKHIRYCTGTDCNVSETADHKWNDGIVTTKPTCATGGIKTFTCTDCGATYTEAVPATGKHIYGDWQKLDDDNHIRYCTGADCDATETADHVWDNGIVTTQPTCATEGVKTFTCSDCGATYTESVPATGKHVYGDWQKLDDDNHIHYCTGTDCDTSETADHVWNNGEITIEPTCATAGVKTFTCDDCGTTYTESVPATGNHTYGNWKKLDDDKHIHYCDSDDCNASETLTHNWDNGVEVGNETVYSCTDCEAERRETLILKGDLNADGSVDKNDAIYLLYSVLFGDTQYPLNQTCDFNADGSVDKNDAIYLLYHALFGATSYPLNT